jgi:N-acetylglucosamine malate deacetylase 1
MTNVVLVVAAHPDDEVLGVGGSIARHADAGDEVNILIVAEGATARDVRRDSQDRRDDIATLRSAATAAANILGAKPPKFGGLPDNRLDSVDLLDLIKLVEAEVDSVKPAIVYTHHGSDLNIDHSLVSRAVQTACRPLPGHGVQALYGFETLSSTEWAPPELGDTFRPNRFVDVSGSLEKKVRALQAYASEMREFPHARSLEAVRALAVLRGASVGFAAAEAFQVVRELV